MMEVSQQAQPAAPVFSEESLKALREELLQKRNQRLERNASYVQVKEEPTSDTELVVMREPKQSSHTPSRESQAENPAHSNNRRRSPIVWTREDEGNTKRTLEKITGNDESMQQERIPSATPEPNEEGEIGEERDSFSPREETVDVSSAHGNQSPDDDHDDNELEVHLRVGSAHSSPEETPEEDLRTRLSQLDEFIFLKRKELELCGKMRFSFASSNTSQVRNQLLEAYMERDDTRDRLSQHLIQEGKEKSDGNESNASEIVVSSSRGAAPFTLPSRFVGAGMASRLQKGYPPKVRRNIPNFKKHKLPNYHVNQGYRY